MHEKAYTDALSGMGNRRAFFEQGEAKLRLASGTDTPMSALMIDIDHFKSVNDQFGHAVGDKVIQGFAEIVLETVRDEDVQGRIGGEEFAIIASNTSLKQAEVLAERIRLAAEKVELLHEGKVIKTTISIGVTTFDPEQDDLSTMMLRADNALYHAKELGRNRVIINT
jgi:diguanylate cyclase (GGDEF)-like protein